MSTEYGGTGQRAELEHVEEPGREGMERAREGLSEIDRRARSFIAQKPMLALGCAIGVGFLLGRLIARNL